MTHAGNFPTSKGGKGKRRGISVLKQTCRSPAPCWEKGRGRRGGTEGALEGMIPRRAGRGAIPREGGGRGERRGFHLQGWVCPSTSLCRQASCFPIPAGRDLPSQQRCPWEYTKKLLPGGESGGQELWDHSVSLHHRPVTTHLNQLEGWHHGLALGWSPQLRGASQPGRLDHRGTNQGRAKPQVPCCLPCAWGVLSQEEMHTQRCLLSKDQRQLRENPLGWQRRK